MTSSGAFTLGVAVTVLVIAVGVYMHRTRVVREAEQFLDEVDR